jgi:hypothetical protein
MLDKVLRGISGIAVLIAFQFLTDPSPFCAAREVPPPPCPYRDTRHGEEMIELLIAHGADINARDNAGRNPIDQMLQNGRRDLAQVLRRHGGDSA